MEFKVFIHYNSLVQFINGLPVTARFNFAGADDVELFIDLKNVVVKRQNGTILIRRKKFFEKLIFWKKWSVE